MAELHPCQGGITFPQHCPGAASSSGSSTAPGLLERAGAGPDGSHGSTRWGPAQPLVPLQGNSSNQVTWTIPIQHGPTRLLVVQILHTPTPGSQRDPGSPPNHQPVSVQPFN